MKIIYVYNTDGIFIEEHKCQYINGKYLIKRNSTEIKPEHGENETSVWNVDSWDIVPDYRGAESYNDTGKKIHINEINIEPRVAPDTSFIRPGWNGSEFIEGATKADYKLLFIIERNKRIIEADKWELPTVLDRYGVTVAQVQEYKQYLCDMPETHTTIDQYKIPDWPDKLITKELL